MRLEPSDEYLHPLGPESNFNESMYINCFDPRHEVGGWFRMGNRANEGYAEMTVYLYLPNGKVGFMFKRPNIDNNDQLEGAGLTWTIVSPFEELRIDYVGKVVVLDNPMEMVEPRQAFKNNPYAEAEVHLSFTGQGRPSMFGGEPDKPHEAPGEEFAKGHYEQLVEATGTIRVGDDSYHQKVTGLLRSSRSGREWRFEGDVTTMIPLRNRRQDPDGNWLVTRISEGMTKWEMKGGEHEGRTGWGMSEYLDQIVDDQPVGKAE